MGDFLSEVDSLTSRCLGERDRESKEEGLEERGVCVCIPRFYCSIVLFSPDAAVENLGHALVDGIGGGDGDEVGPPHDGDLSYGEVVRALPEEGYLGEDVALGDDADDLLAAGLGDGEGSDLVTDEDLGEFGDGGRLAHLPVEGGEAGLGVGLPGGLGHGGIGGEPELVEGAAGESRGLGADGGTARQQDYG